MINGFIDTHAHLDHVRFQHDLDSMLLEARKAGLLAAIVPNCDTETLAPLMRIVRTHAGFLFAAYGLHPTSVTPSWPIQWAIIRKSLESNEVPGVAIGEIGLDCYWRTDNYNMQYEAFTTQLEWALVHDWPVIIHARASEDEVLSLLEEPSWQGLRGVLHAFQGNKAQIERALQIDNFYLGLGGLVTYKGAYEAGAIEQIPLDRVLLETDAPYLTPLPLRGKRNHPGYIRHIVAHLAKRWGIAEEEIMAKSTQNAMSLFRLAGRLAQD